VTKLEFLAIADICRMHAERLQWATQTLSHWLPLTADKLERLTPIDLAVFDQFIVRFSKLQDAMGTKLFPAILELTREPGELDAFIDKLNRLEKIGALSSASQWLKLREMRNQFAHDYPDDKAIQASLLNKAFGMVQTLQAALTHALSYADKYAA
jgi:hypothetical protein